MDSNEGIGCRGGIVYPEQLVLSEAEGSRRVCRPLRLPAKKLGAGFANPAPGKSSPQVASAGDGTPALQRLNH